MLKYDTIHFGHQDGGVSIVETVEYLGQESLMTSVTIVINSEFSFSKTR